MKNIIIKEIGKYIPKKTLTNEYFIEHFKKEEWGNKQVEGLLNHLGRKERHFCERGESSLSMGIEASKNVLEKSNISAEDIDMIVFVSATPEYTSPTNAIMIHNAINAINANVVYDMNGNCIGMITALDNVASFMKTHNKINKALVVGSFHASSVIRFDDTITYSTFGDASSAVILEKVEEETSRGLIGNSYYTKSNMVDNVKLPAIGHSNELLGKYHKYYRRLEWIPFDSKFFTDEFIARINELLDENGITDNDVAYYVFSQLSNAQNKETLTKLGVDINSKYVFNADKYGYTAESSPIIALSEVWDKAKEMSGKYIILISVAAGYTLSAILYKI